MKKTLSVLLCLLLTVSLMAGCGSKEKIEAEPASQSEVASAAEEKTHGTGCTHQRQRKI